MRPWLTPALVAVICCLCPQLAFAQAAEAKHHWSYEGASGPKKIQGHSFPMVAHLVHKDADEKLAVVAVLLKTGHENPFIETLWKNLPADVGQEHAPEGATVELTQLLPANRAYYTFTVEISKPEEAAFAAKHAHNARPVQPLNGRSVQVSR